MAAQTRQARRTISRARLAGLLVLAALAPGLPAAAADWTAYREEPVVRVLTEDADGELRETPVWCIVLDGDVFVRTNDSRWLANIRRGSAVRLLAREQETPVAAEEVADAETAARVEEAFKAKYGALQRLMSTLRLAEPTVLRLTPSERPPAQAP